MPKLVLIRHGESESVRDKRFSGWQDTALSNRGIIQAQHAAKTLAASSIRFDEIHTSLLERSNATVTKILEPLGLTWSVVHKDWRLNKRHCPSSNNLRLGLIVDNRDSGWSGSCLV